MREIRIVGDHTNIKPFMVVEYFRDNSIKYVGHKVLKRFTTKEEAQEFKFAISENRESIGDMLPNTMQKGKESFMKECEKNEEFRNKMIKDGILESSEVRNGNK